MQMVYHLKTNKYIKIVSFLLFLLCVYIILTILNYFNIIIYCPVSYITGYYCPGCGITRMFIALFNLDFYQAFRYNPLTFIYLVLLLIYIILELFNKNVKKVVNNKYFLGTILFITIIFGILRNFDSFKFLRPITL